MEFENPDLHANGGRSPVGRPSGPGSSEDTSAPPLLERRRPRPLPIFEENGEVPLIRIRRIPRAGGPFDAIPELRRRESVR